MTHYAAASNNDFVSYQITWVLVQFSDDSILYTYRNDVSTFRRFAHHYSLQCVYRLCRFVFVHYNAISSRTLQCFL